MPAIVSTVIDVYVFRRIAVGVEFLLLKRSAARQLGETWQSVHGKIEAGETAVAAALRELREETGLAPLRFWQIDHVNSFYVARSDEVHICACFAAEVSVDANVVLSDEHTAFRWLCAEAAQREFLWPGQRRAVEEICAYVIPGGPTEPHLRISI